MRQFGELRYEVTVLNHLVDERVAHFRSVMPVRVQLNVNALGHELRQFLRRQEVKNSFRQDRLIIDRQPLRDRGQKLVFPLR